ncbi:MAG: PTS sugar transporter subunit IIA [Spirochaetes bacterium]|nr:PTS sugar transporter subunit IIA [Spirochaetota bacterium]MBU1081073.1 PTS sugar transporter subunit IIA [Spirochaetota bacterium]
MDIAALLTRGGVWYNIPGATSADFIESMVASVSLPASIGREELAQACARREANSPTAMGRGLAFPHPGIPMAKGPEEAFVAVAYPRFPINWRAPDGAPVKAVFLIISDSRNEHLTTLSSLAKLCGDEDFYAALLAEAPLEVLAGLVRAKPAGKN